MPTLSELLTPTTSTAALNTALARLQEAEFPTTDWSSTSPERVLMEIHSRGLADLSDAAPAIAAGALLYLSSGDWLTLLAANTFATTRRAETSTVGHYLLTNTSATAYTITEGAFWVRNPVTGNRYYASTSGLLAGPGTLDITITAEGAGSEYNDAANTITDILTPLSGVTGTNYEPDFSDPVHTGSGPGTVTPSGVVAAATWVVRISLGGALGAGEFEYNKNGGAFGAAIVIPGGGVYGPDGDGLVITFAAATYVLGDRWTFAAPGSWTTTQGTDEESDDSLRARCAARWALLNSIQLVAGTLTSYDGLAREASEQVTRTKIETSATILNTVNVYIATAAGVAGVNLVADVQAYMDARKAVTDRIVVASASGSAITLAGTIRVRAGYKTAAQALLDDLITAYLLTGPTSGDPDQTDIEVVAIGGTIYFSQMVELCMRPDGVRSASITVNGGTADVTLGATNCATWAQSAATAFTWVEV